MSFAHREGRLYKAALRHFTAQTTAPGASARRAPRRR